jgi:hypothetical protein
VLTGTNSLGLVLIFSPVLIKLDRKRILNIARKEQTQFLIILTLTLNLPPKSATVGSFCHLLKYYKIHRSSISKISRLCSLVCINLNFSEHILGFQFYFFEKNFDQKLINEFHIYVGLTHDGN